MVESLDALRGGRTAPGENRHGLLDHLRKVSAEKPRVEDHFRMRSQFEGQSRTVEPLHFRQRKIKAFPARQGHAEIDAAHDLGELRIIRKADRQDRIVEVRGKAYT